MWSACRRTSNFRRKWTKPCAAAPKAIGLYRTEFLYLASDHEPSEEEHYGSYADALLRLKSRPLVIRTLDLGADKYTQAKARNPERNPFLGDRSIRMCLHDIPMFKRQLRAIMRASVLGDVRDHVSDDQHADGAAAGEDGAERCDGRAGGRRRIISAGIFPSG